MTETIDQIGQSLAGRLVVLAGWRDDVVVYENELKRCGANVIICPEVVLSEPESYARLDEAQEHLFGYDWLLFTSAAGVEHFLHRLQAKGLEADSLDDLKVCAIGEATEQLLREAHVHVDLAPSTPESQTVFAALERFVGGHTALSGLNFLWPRAAPVNDLLTRALNDAGARVDVVPAYRIRSDAEMDLGRIAAMLCGAADCVMLTSPAAISNLARLFDAHNLSEPLADLVVACVDDATARAAVERALQVDIVPGQPDAPTFAWSVVNYFS